MEAFAPIDTIMPMFMDAGRNSNDYMGEVALGFFQFVAWAAILYGALRVTVGADSMEGTSLQVAAWFLRIFILGTIAAFLLPTILPALIDGAFGIGTGLSGGKLSAADFLVPSRLFNQSWTEVEIIMKHAMSRTNGPVSFFKNFALLVYYLLASLVILIAFVVMIGMVILSYVYFIMEAIGVVLTIMFGASEKTQWMGRGGPATLVNRFVQMVMMSGVLSIGLVVLEVVRLTGDPTVAQAVVEAVVAIIVAVGVLKSEQIGASVVGGMPGPTAGGTAGGMVGGAASLLGAGIGGAAAIGRSALNQVGGGTPGNPGTSNTPPPPPRGGPQSGPTGQGHGSAPFGPGAGAGSSSGSSALASQASAQISQQARMLPKGTGDGAEAPTAQQWQDAKIMGTDIVGMTRSQAGSALSAHQDWYTSRGTGGGAAAPSSAGLPSSHAGKGAAPAMVSAPADWMGGGASGKPAGASVPSSAVADSRKGLSGSGASANPGERPLMRSAAGASVRRTFSPKSGGTGHQVALNSHRNDGRFEIGEELLGNVGGGGGEFGTGYRRPGWQSPSVRKTGIPALTGESYWQRRDTAKIRQTHFGVMSRQPHAPKSAAASL